MKQTKEINVEVALRNIESSMRAEGFLVSRETTTACSEILKSGKNAAELADFHVKQTLKKAR